MIASAILFGFIVTGHGSEGYAFVQTLYARDERRAGRIVERANYWFERTRVLTGAWR